MTRIVVHPADEHGCGHYRLIWPAAALIGQGHDVQLSFDANYRAIWQPSAWGDRIIGLADPIEADVVVLQRPMHRHRVELIAALQAQGVAVVVEIDDDFHAIHRNNVAWRDSNPLHDRDHNRDWLKLACERADLVTVSTPALAERYGQHGRCIVLPNYVPKRYLKVARNPAEGSIQVPVQPPVLGWAGSIDTHPRDLQQTEGAVAEAVLASGAIFRVIGTGKGVQSALRLHDPVEALGWMPLHAYPEGLATLDVGIAPLQLSLFNQAKSAIKGLEYGSVGVPWVASPTEDYRRVHSLGAGVLAATRDDWYAELYRLATDDAYRADRAAQDRAVSATQTIEAHAHLWLEAWANARSSKMAAA